MYFGPNIKYLRKRRGLTQEDVAGSLNLKRSTLNNYENLAARPGMETLVSFSDFYRIAIDTLIRVDLAKLPESQMRQVERGFDVFIRGSNLRVLTTTVSSDNEENIELVPEKAKAGYAAGFADPEYISILPTFRLPFLSRQKKYRTFQISGDSMLPIPDRAWVTGVYVQDWSSIRNKDAYIILTSDEGIVFKVVENKLKEEGKLVLHSLNARYEPYDLAISEIREVWQFVHYISGELPDNEMVSATELTRTVNALREEVKAIQMKLNL
jgi:transcriptional regulator with XRE-family HTH domain